MPTMIKYGKLVFCFFFLAPALQGQTAYSSPDFNAGKLYKPEVLREDFRILRRALEEAHPGLYIYNNKERLNVYFDSIYNSLKNPETELQFYSTISACISKIGCGHTPCFLPKEFVRDYEDQKCLLFPIKVKILDRRIFVQANYSTDSSIVPGAEIKSINGEPASSIIDRIISHLSSDGYNLTLKYHLLEEDFAHYYAELINQPQWFRVQYSQPESPLLSERMIPALYYPQIEQIAEKRFGKNALTPTKEKPLEFQLTADKIGMLRISSFDGRDISHAGQHFHSFIRNVFDTLRQKGVNDLVIDLRNNVGGDDDYGWYLYSFLSDTAFRYYKRVELSSDKRFSILRYTSHPFCINFMHLFSKRDKEGHILWTHGTYTHVHQPNKYNYWGRVWILINGESFSTTAEFASMVHAHNKGLFVGEESGGASEGDNSGMEILLTLPGTHLRIRIPLFRYISAINDPVVKGRGIIPDYTIQPTMEDVIQKKDTEKDFLLTLIRSRNCKGCGR